MRAFAVAAPLALALLLATANVLAGRALRREPARDSVRLDLLVLDAPEAPPLRLELPAYAYYRLGIDRRREFLVQLKPEWLHLMPDPIPGAHPGG